MTVDDSLSMLRFFLPRADSAQLTVSKLSKGKVIFTAAIFTLADPSLAARTRVTYLRLVTAVTRVRLCSLIAFISTVT